MRNDQMYTMGSMAAFITGICMDGTFTKCMLGVLAVSYGVFAIMAMENSK